MRNIIRITICTSLLMFSFHQLTSTSDDTQVIDIVEYSNLPDPVADYSDLPDPIIVDDVEDFLVKIDPQEFDCLRKNIYFEAGNQSYAGKEAVAVVTLNRTKVKTYPDDVCGVVFQRKQFSWTHLVKNQNPPKNILDRRQWEIAGEVAYAALSGTIVNRVGNSTHYHANYVNPNWSQSARMKKIATIGSHIFYQDVKLKTHNS